VELRADLVVELLDAAGKVVLAVVLEVQREKKPRKKYTWPVYWTVVRAERECPAVVLVVAPDGEIAAWAAEELDLGMGLGHVTPLVLGPATLPVLTDPGVAANEVELSVLSAMAHGNGPEGLAVVQAALLAVDTAGRFRYAEVQHLLLRAERQLGADAPNRPRRGRLACGHPRDQRNRRRLGGDRSRVRHARRRARIQLSPAVSCSSTSSAALRSRTPNHTAEGVL
jgi:hypothetical protein